MSSGVEERSTHKAVSTSELERRTIRREDLVSCNQAFIDCRTPGSDKKENYALIGSGVSQSAEQVINLQQPHGYNVGGAAMPNGVTNSLHLHFTAEVFLVVEGEYKFRWGVDGNAGEFIGRSGDILRSRPGSSAVSPTWGRKRTSCSPCWAATSPAASSGAPAFFARPPGTGWS